MVANHELLFRAVSDADEHHRIDENGFLLLGQSAFNDRERTPSVDRAELQGGGPQATRREDADGVVILQAAEIRSICTVATCDAHQNILRQHNVDVRHVPVLNNYSHGQVEAAPHVTSGGAWKKLKEALCRVAMKRGWAFKPASLR